MEKDLQKLLETVVLSEETKAALTEAWTTKVAQVREEALVELREEFASRFEHDKTTIIEATEKFITDRLTKETGALIDGQKKLAEERVALANKVDAVASKFQTFAVQKLAEELKEFKGERGALVGKMAKAEQFIIRKLAEELKEYADSKTKLVEERVAVESEKKAQIEAAKKLFVEKATALAERVISEGLKAEFTQLREELAEARKLTFGRKIFESYMAEYTSNFFNESAEVKKIKSEIDALAGKLEEATKVIAEKDAKLVESAKQIRMTNELVERKNVLDSLLSPLNKEKGAIMGKLLESVETRKLTDSYKKFLPSVLGVHDTAEKTTLTETSVAGTGSNSHEGKRTVDGNRKAQEETTEDRQIVELVSLARLPKRVL